MGLSSYTEWLASLPEEERKLLEKENAEAEAILEEFGTAIPFTIKGMVAESEIHDLEIEVSEDEIRVLKNNVLSSSG